MGNPAVTYTFTNSTTADATQVNQNFTDLINGATDGTKDYSISALTAAGTATLNGDVNLGNSSADTLVVTASLGSTIAIKTNATYDIGSSTLGLAGMYLGSASSKTTRLVGAATTSYTLTLPVTAGTAGQGLQTDGSGTTSWVPTDDPSELTNVSIAASISSNTLVVALKGKDGNDPSATNPVYVGFRSATATTGTYAQGSFTAANSITLAADDSIGATSGATTTVYVYLISDTTSEIALSLTSFDEGTLQSASALTGSADTTATALWSTNAHTSRPIRLIGKITAVWSNPNWGTISEVTTIPFGALGIITRWVPYTPTFTGFGTTSLVFARSRRVGDSLEVAISFNTGTLAASEARVSLGFNGTDGNVAVAAWATDRLMVGNFVWDTAVAQVGYCHVTTPATYMRFGLASGAFSPWAILNGNQMFGNTSSVEIICRGIPIAGWGNR